jgi:hypothetical protein
MVTTGWIGEEPDAAGPALPVTNMLLSGSRGGQQPGAVLAQSLARAAAEEVREERERAAVAHDPDDYAAGLVARGYMPGLVSQLSQRLGDTMAELEEENGKIEKAAKRSEHLRRAHEAGRITAFDIARSLGEGDEGDPSRVAMLERRVAKLKQQIGEAQDAISPPRDRPLDGVESASRHARAVLGEVIRPRERPAPPELPPFAGSVSRGAGRSTEHTGPDCWVCEQARRRDAARAREDYAAVYGEITR